LRTLSRSQKIQDSHYLDRTPCHQWMQSPRDGAVQSPQEKGLGLRRVPRKANQAPDILLLLKKLPNTSTLLIRTLTRSIHMDTIRRMIKETGRKVTKTARLKTRGLRLIRRKHHNQRTTSPKRSYPHTRMRNLLTFPLLR
jgi:hypothetical protein